jgi:hypothetical protein
MSLRLFLDSNFGFDTCNNLNSTPRKVNRHSSSSPSSKEFPQGTRVVICYFGFGFDSDSDIDSDFHSCSQKCSNR